MTEFQWAAEQVKEGLAMLGLKADPKLQRLIDLRSNDPGRCTGKTTKMILHVLIVALNADIQKDQQKFIVFCNTKSRAKDVQIRLTKVLDALNLPYTELDNKTTIDIPARPIIMFESVPYGYQVRAMEIDTTIYTDFDREIT